MNFQQMLHTTLLQGQNPESQGMLVQQAESWERENPSLFFSELATYLADEQKPEQARFLAGMMLKNTFEAQDSELNQFKVERWKKGIDNEVKVHVRKMAYTTLASENINARKAASQVIGKIGVLDLDDEWPDLMTMLMNVSVDAGSSQTHILAALDSIGYICEDSDNLEKFSDAVLTSVVHNISVDTPAPLVSAALGSLRHALPFCEKNILVPGERTLLVNSMARCATHSDESISQAALGVLIDMASMYYDHLGDQMETLFGVTLAAIREADEDIAKYAIEFWNTICEYETVAQAEGMHSSNFAVAALKEMTPVLLESILKQDDPEYDSDDFSLPIAASVSLKFFAQAVKEEIIQHLMPFIEQNIASQEWTLQDAALLALIAVLEVPRDSITQIIDTAVPILLNLLQTSTVPAIRDNSAWTLGQIVKVHPEASFKFADDVFSYMGNALQNDSPRIAAHACWTIHNMAECYEGHPQSPVVKHFAQLFEVLLATGDRADATEYGLRSSAYETIIVLLMLAPDDVADIYTNMLKATLDRLEQTIVAHEDQAMAEAAELCCGVIQVITSRMENRVSGFADRIMTALLALLGSGNGKQCSHDAFLAITAVEQSLDTDFEKYISATLPFVFQGLKNWKDSNACNAATDLVSDLANIMGPEVINCSDQLMECLVANMKQDSLDRMVKPTTIRSWGDISMALGYQFSKYSAVILEILYDTIITLSNVDYTQLDFEDEDYVDVLRACTFETLASIITCASQTEKDLIKSFAQEIMNLINLTAIQEDRPVDLVYATWGLLGDMIGLFGPTIRDLTNPSLRNIAVQLSRNTSDPNEKEALNRAIESLKSINL